MAEQDAVPSLDSLISQLSPGMPPEYYQGALKSLRDQAVAAKNAQLQAMALGMSSIGGGSVSATGQTMLRNALRRRELIRSRMEKIQQAQAMAANPELRRASVLPQAVELQNKFRTGRNLDLTSGNITARTALAEANRRATLAREGRQSSLFPLTRQLKELELQKRSQDLNDPLSRYSVVQDPVYGGGYIVDKRTAESRPFGTASTAPGNEGAGPSVLPYMRTLSKMPTQDRDAYTNAKAALDSIQLLKKAGESSGFDDPGFLDKLRSYGNWIVSQASPALSEVYREAMYNPSEKSYMALMDMLASDLRNKLAGTAVSEQEEKNIRKWVATSDVLPEQRSQNLQAMEAFARNKMNSLEKQYGLPSADKVVPEEKKQPVIIERQTRGDITIGRTADDRYFRIFPDGTMREIDMSD